MRSKTTIEIERRAAIGGAETVRDAAGVDAEVGRRHVEQRQRMFVRRRTGRPRLGRWWQQFAVPHPSHFRRRIS